MIDNIVNIVEGIINNDTIDSPRPQYQNWHLEEYTGKAPHGYLDSVRGIHFGVNEEAAKILLEYFEKKGCIIREYTGKRELIKRVYVWHS